MKDGSGSTITSSAIENPYMYSPPDGRTGVGSIRIAEGGTTEIAIEVK